LPPDEIRHFPHNWSNPMNKTTPERLGHHVRLPTTNYRPNPRLREVQEAPLDRVV
jgi:hypothetical protein